MSRVLLGLLLGLLLAGAALAFEYPRRAARCFDRCGSGTSCTAGSCVASAAPAPAAPALSERKRRRRSSSPGAAAGDPLAAPELALQPGDEAVQSSGDALGRPEAIDFDDSRGKGEDEARLSDEAIERVFASVRPAVSACIGRAVGDYPLERAHVEVGARIERTGRVEKVRLTAPTLLQRQGLMRCVRPLVAGLHFPASGGASVVTWPFDLQ